MAESESKESKELFQASPSAGQIELLFRSGVFLLLRISSRGKAWRTRVPHTHTYTHIYTQTVVKRELVLCVWLKVRQAVLREWFTELPAGRIAKEISFHRRTPTPMAKRLNLLEIRGRGNVPQPDCKILRGETIDLFSKCLIGVSSWDWFFVVSATERWGLFFEDI